jgi:hypothetical protein
VALELLSKISEATASTSKTQSAKARRSVTAGGVVRIDVWKKQRPTRGKAAETETVMVDARGSWIESVVGAFDGNPIYERIMANNKAFRESLERQLTSE